MMEIDRLARKDFSGQSLGVLEYEDLMTVSKNWTRSFKFVMENRISSPALCLKSGDLIKFYLKER